MAAASPSGLGAAVGPGSGEGVEEGVGPTSAESGASGIEEKFSYDAMATETYRVFRFQVGAAPCDHACQVRGQSLKRLGGVSCVSLTRSTRAC
jgi:hypothetical protein